MPLLIGGMNGALKKGIMIRGKGEYGQKAHPVKPSAKKCLLLEAKPVGWTYALKGLDWKIVIAGRMVDAKNGLLWAGVCRSRGTTMVTGGCLRASRGAQEALPRRPACPS